MNKFKVTHYQKELGMTLNTIVETDLTAEEYMEQAKKAPKGLKRPLSEVTAVVPI